MGGAVTTAIGNRPSGGKSGLSVTQSAALPILQNILKKSLRKHFFFKHPKIISWLSQVAIILSSSSVRAKPYFLFVDVFQKWELFIVDARWLRLLDNSVNRLLLLRRHLPDTFHFFYRSWTNEATILKKKKEKKKECCVFSLSVRGLPRKLIVTSLHSFAEDSCCYWHLE